MNKETIEKLNNSQVGDVIETKNWIITVYEYDNKFFTDEDCFLFGKNGCCFKIECCKTKDGRNHIFKRTKKETTNEQ